MAPDANGAVAGPVAEINADHTAERIDEVLTKVLRDSPQGLEIFCWLHEIEIGERFRKDLGDIASLADSIREVGLLHPPVITSTKKLIAGRRRLAALELLYGPKYQVRCRAVPLDDIVRGEAAENFARKDFTLSEAVAIKRAIEPEIKAAAAERMKAGQPLPKLDKGRADDKVSAFTGVKRTTLAKADAVVKAAEAEPEKFGKLVEQMDRTGRADGPYKRLQNIKASDEIRKEPPGLPMNGPYRAGIIDAPWASEPDADKDHGARAFFPYPTMTPEQVAAMPVPGILHADASVWLWITNFHLLRGDHLVIAKAWGMKPVALLTWLKSRWGQGQRARGATEHVIQLVRGNVASLGFDQKTWFEGAGGVHSQKPTQFYEIVEKLTPAPVYFELFSRAAPRANWDMHGNEVGKTVCQIGSKSDPIKKDVPVKEKIVKHTILPGVEVHIEPGSVWTKPESKPAVSPIKTVKALAFAYLDHVPVDEETKATIKKYIIPRVGHRSLKQIDLIQSVHSYPSSRRTRKLMRSIDAAWSALDKWHHAGGHLA